jgi:hypothetical protein
VNKYKQIIFHSQEINFSCKNDDYLEKLNLSPLAPTDTEVASLKFHLTADAWEYPDWALFESFSPTTGDDLQLVVEPAIRTQLEQIQRVEFASSPPTGGPINICACGIILLPDGLKEIGTKGVALKIN